MSPTLSMIHTDTDYAATGYDESLKAVYLIYKRKGSSTEFRDANLRLINTIAQMPSERLFIDARAMGVVAPEDQRWVGTEVVPKLASYAPNKYLYIASVLSEYVFTKMAVQTIVEISVSLGVCQNMLFDSDETAKQWLTKQPSGGK